MLRASQLVKTKFNPTSLSKSLSSLNYSTAAATATVDTKQLKSMDQIPGPKTYPIIGNLFELKAFGGDFDMFRFGDVCNKLQGRYGDIVRFQIFNQKQVFIFHPEYIKKVFAIDGEYPIRPDILPLKKYNEYKKIPDTLANSQGERWRTLRSASNPIAAKVQNVFSFLGKHDEVADDFLNLIDKKFENNNSIVLSKFEEDLKLAALEMVSVVAFDQRINCIDVQKRDPNIEKFVKSIDSFMEQFGILFFSLPLWHYFPTKDWRKLVSNGDYMYKTVKEYVDKVFREMNNSNSNTKGKTILQQYLLTMDKYNLTTKDVISLTSDFLLGGVDTTSTTLHYILYEIGRNKDIQNRLYEEIKQNFKNKDDHVTEDRLSNMPYLKAIMKEALRVHSIVPGNSRVIKTDLVLEDYLIPKGTFLNMGYMYITKSERFFKNASEFDPRRWLRNDEKTEENVHPYAHLPFGFGARQCIGRRIAEQEIYTLLTKMIQRYEVDYVGEKFGYRTKIIASPDKPLNIRFTKRN